MKEENLEILDDLQEVLPLNAELDLVKPKTSKLIVAMVKRGFAYSVIKVANENGAQGAVILDGRGAINSKKKFFGMDLAPEREVVLMVVDEQIVYPVIKSIYAIADFKSNAKGVVFAVPISMIID